MWKARVQLQGRAARCFSGPVAKEMDFPRKWIARLWCWYHEADDGRTWTMWWMFRPKGYSDTLLDCFVDWLLPSDPLTKEQS